MQNFLYIFSFVMGLCFGSFANVVIYRVPKKISIWKPPSSCPSCERKLTVIDLFPVLSWIFLRGKCRTCKNKISARYPLVEFLCGLLFVSAVYFSATFSAAPLAIFFFALLTITFIDADTQIIPDGLVILGAVAGIFFVAGGHFFPEIFPHAQSWQNALLGILAGAAPLMIFDALTLLILKKDGFGYGDVKLMAMAGIFLGWKLIFMAFFAAFMTGAIFAVYLLVSGKAKRGAYMAFGPFLVLGILAAFWFGETVLEFYFVWLDAYDPSDYFFMR
ncbi:MAG: prepilin peptidase [Defluviitaleaceae bacterium]|nr:prepilin peptidase [Defluviitaleaceae bacterium]